MNAPSDDPAATLRKSIYTLLIVLGTGVMLGRILAVDSVDSQGLRAHLLKQIPRELDQRRAKLEAENWPQDRIQRELGRVKVRLQERAELMRPFLSANDRSRWCTLRALVEPEMRVWREFEQDGKTYAQWVPYAIDNVIAQQGWDTIDMVKHARKLDGDGREYLYSSKPPLLPTLIAVPYWIIHQVTGATLGTHPYEIGRAMLILVNVVPLVIYFFILARLVERFGTSDWGRIFVMAAATLGTFLTTFAIVLNNHLPGGGERPGGRLRHGADLFRRRATLALLRAGGPLFGVHRSLRTAGFGTFRRLGGCPVVEVSPRPCLRFRAGGPLGGSWVLLDQLGGPSGSSAALHPSRRRGQLVRLRIPAAAGRFPHDRQLLAKQNRHRSGGRAASRLCAARPGRTSWRILADARMAAEFCGGC